MFDAELAVLELVLSQHVVGQLFEHRERPAGLAAGTAVGEQQREGPPHALVLQRQLVLVLIVQGAHVHGAERALLAGKHRLRHGERWRVRERYSGISEKGRQSWYLSGVHLHGCDAVCY